MRRLPSRNNLFIGSWYIGAGNKPSVISQKPAKAFSKVREVYKDYQVKRSGKALPIHTPLSELEKEDIRKRLIQYYNRQFYLKLTVIAFALSLTLSLLWFISWFLKESIEGVF